MYRFHAQGVVRAAGVCYAEGNGGPYNCRQARPFRSRIRRAPIGLMMLDRLAIIRGVRRSRRSVEGGLSPPRRPK